MHNYSVQSHTSPVPSPTSVARPSGVRMRRVLQQAPPEGDIFQAAASGDRDWLLLSLRNVSCPKQTDKQGLSLLHVAAMHGHLGCLKLLLESCGAGGDVNGSCPPRPEAHTHGGAHTALDLARVWGHRAIARFLKDSMWQEENQRQVERHNELLKLRQTLVRIHQQMQDETKVARQAISEQRVEEWARLKGLPLPQPAPKKHPVPRLHPPLHC
ncbi:hypothetical protein SKAU_G00029230 [Synaphobranchus kaupii]|uniref:Uncharacterized protein n=1 Tax=Synaphobranchus kaupii TaxID=118154 RepID=A0A9Q1GDF8_SYNKA|nr:hypothetical protein SKAU_G00029230 [Synaphobranchus kaupii]